MADLLTKTPLDIEGCILFAYVSEQGAFLYLRISVWLQIERMINKAFWCSLIRLIDFQFFFAQWKLSDYICSFFMWDKTNEKKNKKKMFCLFELHYKLLHSYISSIVRPWSIWHSRKVCGVLWSLLNLSYFP